MKKIIQYVCLIAVIAVIAVLSVVLVVQNAAEGEERFVVSPESSAETQFSVSGLHPGDSVTAEYGLSCNAADVVYTVTFDGKEGGLSAYLTVSVTVSGEKLYEGSLENAIGEKLTKAAEGGADVTIVYTLPLDADNAAQGLTADVSITFGAEKEI